MSHVIYISIVGIDRAQSYPYYRVKLETERVIENSPVPHTILRATQFHDFVLGMVRLLDRLPVMITPSWVSTLTQPIALDDIARYLAGVCGHAEARGESYDAGGPEVMTYRQMIERIAKLRGRRPLIVEVPVLTPRLSSLWLQLVTPVEASVARPLVEGLRNPTVARDERIRALLPFELTSFDAAARQALRP